MEFQVKELRLDNAIEANQFIIVGKARAIQAQEALTAAGVDFKIEAVNWKSHGANRDYTDFVVTLN